MFDFVAGSEKEPSSIIIQFPHTLIFPPQTFLFSITLSYPDFHSPQPISIEALYICWFSWRSQKWLTLIFNIVYSKIFPVFRHNLCANGANNDLKKRA